MHARCEQDDRAVAVILGMKKVRLCGEDAFARMLAKVPRPEARTWLRWSERDLYAALPSAFVAPTARSNAGSPQLRRS